jgi:hypothetical protein
MNYTQLVTAVTDYTENTFPTADMNVFIGQAEQRIYSSVQFPSLRKNVIGQIEAYNATTNPRAMYVSCPDDFLAAYSFATIDGSGNYEYLLNKDVNFIRQAYPNPSSTSAPKYYAIFGPTTSAATPPALTNELSLILGPTPDASYDVELHYYFYPESIVTAGTTWLGDNFDSVLLYGTLVEAYTYMKGEADLALAYNTKYNEALSLAKRLGDGLERGDAYRDGQAKIKVT